MLPEGITVKELKTQLENAELTLELEMAKSVIDRDLDAVKQQYAPLADQTQDDIVQAYSRKRIEQIDAMNGFVMAARDAGVFVNRIATERDQWREQRVAIQPTTYTPTGQPDFVIQGELRPSLIYDSPTGPVRYRLVDPQTEAPRTLAYVQLVDGLHYNMMDFFGRIVGVHAKERIILEGSVDAIPIYVANELVVVDKTYLLLDKTYSGYESSPTTGGG